MSTPSQHELSERERRDDEVAEIDRLRRDYGELRARLDRLVGDTAYPPTPSPTVDAAGADAAFKYKLLSALMTAGPLNALTVTVTRNRDGLTVDRCGSGVHGGKYLSFAASGGVECNTFEGKAFEFKLCDDKISAEALSCEHIDIWGPFESFVLRTGPTDGGGVIVAIAPSLPAQTCP